MRPGYQCIFLLATSILYWSDYSFGQQSIASLDEIQVLGDRLDYSPSGFPSPALIYGRNHFLSFEPLAVGDMLNRVSGVAFTGDIGENDAPQLRGLGSRYTQVLIDGERVPGNSADRTVLLDRVPAELIERIELIRSPTPDMDSQGIGGTLNLILKDSGTLSGTNWRLGGFHYPDLEPATRGAASVTHSVNSSTLDFLLSANIQERLNPKAKNERVFDGDGSLDRVTRANDFKDSTDRAIQSSLAYNLGELGTLDLRMTYIDSRIDENEFIEVLNEGLQADSNGKEKRHITQNRFEAGAGYNRSLSESIGLLLGFSVSRFDDRTDEQEAVFEEGLEQVELRQFTRTDDLEIQLNTSLSWQLSTAHEIEFGLGISHEDRDARQLLLELEDDELVDSTPGNGVFSVEETLTHAYLMDSWNLSNAVALQYGLRIEDTDLVLRGRIGKTGNSLITMNPSAHLLFQPDGSNQFRASIARTLRRPGFNELIPFSNRDTPDEDLITVGNPELKPEYAWGLDVGYSHEFINNPGNIGINLFYRSIEDKIELGRIAEDVFSPGNIGTGRTWGLELDFSLPFTFLNWPDVGVFGNYVWIDSRIDDPFTGRERQFNLQPEYIANLDLYHDVPALDLSHGISWQQQGKAKEFLTDEIKTVRYDSNLEYFIEKRIGSSFVVRLTVNNILDARKHERGKLYRGLGDLIGGTVDETIIEREQAEPIFAITVRGSF